MQQSAVAISLANDESGLAYRKIQIRLIYTHRSERLLLTTFYRTKSTVYTLKSEFYLAKDHK